jgi:hypothetical protein
MPALSAMLRKSSATINSSHQGSTDVGPTIPFEPRQAIPSDTLHAARPHFVRSSSFNNAVIGAPKINLEPEDTSDIGSPGHSPLPRKASSIRTIRRASQQPALEKRASFGAPQEITASLALSPVPNRGRPFLQTNAPSLAVPDGSSLLSPSGKRSDISRSHNAFTSDSGPRRGEAQSMFKTLENTGRSLSTHGHRDIARSAILSGLGQPVEDDEKMGTTFTSHDMMSTNSRWTDHDDTYQTGSSNETTEATPREIQEWHELHRAPKVIRSMRFSFNTATSSTMEPGEIFKRLHRTLRLLSKQYENRFQFQRQNPDYLQLTCRLLPNSRNSSEPPLLFEVEVCKVWLLNLHGIRIKRIAGNPIMFKEIFGFVESELKI